MLSERTSNNSSSNSTPFVSESAATDANGSNTILMTATNAGSSTAKADTLMSPFAPTHLSGMVGQQSQGLAQFSAEWNPQQQHQHQQQQQEQTQPQQQSQQTTPQQSTTPGEKSATANSTTYPNSEITPSARHKIPYQPEPSQQAPQPAYYPGPPQMHPQSHQQQQQQQHQQQQQQQQYEFRRPDNQPQQTSSTVSSQFPTFAAYAAQQQPGGATQPQAQSQQPYGGSYLVSQPYPVQPPQPAVLGQQQAHQPPPAYSGGVVPPPGFSYSAHPSSYAGYVVTGQDGMIQQGPPGVVFARTTDPRIARPKVKLTYDDKRRIVEIARSNTSLRQEDIAQQYGVDRSTISKILISAHRWTGPPQPPIVPIPKQVKASGGRFPAIEQRMHEWMDAQHAAGYEIRDNIARDMAKGIARGMGFTEERFKASAKWLDKFKDRRKQLGLRASVTATFESDRPFLAHCDDGVPVIYSDTRHQANLPFSHAYVNHGFYPPHLQPGPSYAGSGSGSPVSILSRSQSSATLASSDSSEIDIYPHQQMQSGRFSASNKSDSDMMSLTTSTSDIAVSDALGHHSRHRSRSSPSASAAFGAMNGQFQAPGLDPAHGRAPRLSTTTLQRQNSYHGAASPSPRRQNSGLHRSNSSASSVSHKRGSRPTSLAASAFGLTPMSAPQSEDNSPYPSPVGVHPHHTSFHHAVGGPMSVIDISPGTISSAGTLSSSSSTNSITAAHPGHLPPLTPVSHQTHYPQHMQHQQHHLYEMSKLSEAQHHPQYYNHAPQHHHQESDPVAAQYAYASYPQAYNPRLSAQSDVKHPTSVPWSG